VQTARLANGVRELTGVAPTVAGGEVHTLRTRNTAQALPSQRACEFALEHFRSLGLDARILGWRDASYSNRNVEAIWPGTTRSNEFIVVCAHLDNMPNGDVAPGADDNGSGSVAVLTAAELLRACQFERSLRFVLFTGEEQGLRGSAVYAAALAGAGVNVGGTVNLDMIAWDAKAGPTNRLYIRTVSHPLYSNDLAIAATFSNVVSAYGLGGALAPVISPTGMGQSDHVSFWNNGYPAMLAIEDYPADYSAYYHKTNDTLASLNLAYFTAFVRAAVGTAAHLAGPVGRAGFDGLRIDNSAWSDGAPARTLVVRHEPGAAEGGPDGRDVTGTNGAFAPAARELGLRTQPYGAALSTDARPVESETLFRASLTAAATNATPFGAADQLRFRFLCPPDSHRVYTARIRVDGRFTTDAGDFVCVTNLRALDAGGGFVALPALTNLTNGAVYGTCDVGGRWLAAAASNVMVALGSATGGVWTVTAPVQVGTRVADTVEASTNLLDAHGWVAVGAFTNTPLPSGTEFDDGWQALVYPCATPSSNAASVYMRLLRRWLEI
jgi:hypothetical protein